MLRRKNVILSKAGQTVTVTSDVYSHCARKEHRLLCRLISTADVTGTLDVKVQHNSTPTAALGWKDLISFTQKTSETGESGIEDVHVPFITTHLFPHFRAVATIAGGGTYTFDVELWFDN